MKLKDRTIKLISFFLIMVIMAPSVLLSRPKPAEALLASWLTDIFTGSTAVSTGGSVVANTTSTAISIKSVAKEILQQVVMTVQRRLLAEMTKSMVNWINSGFHGSPLFLQNPESFFRDIAKYEIRTFIDLTGYDPLHQPFGKYLALDTINSFKRKFEDNARYSLSEAIQDPRLLNSYRNNFNAGGWNAFLINSQYPQNNYLGYRMMYTEELARRLEGTVVNKVNQVKNTLEQGMGFLAPQTCPSNPKYNNGSNEFQRPTLKSRILYEDYLPFNENHQFDNSEAAIKELAEADKKFQSAKAEERAAWAKDNTCPGGLKTTTPGFVVASQITNAMGSNFRQTELGAALGNSMSAIFDALLNHFLDKGLSSLASKVNPPPPSQNEWTYDGQNLGTGDTSGNGDWSSLPDEIVVLDNFKKDINGITTRVANAGETFSLIIDNIETPQVAKGGEIISEIGNTGKGEYAPGAIVNTEIELRLINNLTGDPGITQVISQTWPKVRELDMCLPGPDLGWEDRMLKEMNRNSEKLQEKLNDQNGEKAADAQLVYNDLQYAVSSFKDWINNKMILELPSSVLYMDAIDEIDTLYQQSEELTTKKRTKTETLARLGAIKIELDTLTKQPLAGSSEEKILISLRKKYNAILSSISNTASIEDTKNDLAIAQDKLNNLNKLLTRCNTERKTKGWSTPGGSNSTFTTPPGTAAPAGTPVNSPTTPSTEKGLFCDAPIKGGFPHGAFKNNGTENYVPTYPDLPLVNGQDVFKYLRKLVAVFTLGIRGHRTVNIQLSCNIIYNANIIDYKKDLPGLTNIPDPYREPAQVDDFSDGTESGTCTYSDINTGAIITANTSQGECSANNGSWVETTPTGALQ